MLKEMTKKINTAIIVAAGSGTRLASEIPKQFLKLRDTEILSYSVRTFLTHAQIDEVIIVASEEYLEHVKERYPKCIIVRGGATRQDSVQNGLSVCSPDTQIVLIHDAARPLIPTRVIDDCLAKLKTLDGVAPTLQPVNSMVELTDSGYRSLPRHDMRIMQTPQCFHINILKAAHASTYTATDELALVKQHDPQARLGFVEGAPENIKVTRQIDLEIIEMYLRKLEV